MTKIPTTNLRTWPWSYLRSGISYSDRNRNRIRSLKKFLILGYYGRATKFQMGFNFDGSPGSGIKGISWDGRPYSWATGPDKSPQLRCNRS